MKTCLSLLTLLLLVISCNTQNRPSSSIHYVPPKLAQESAVQDMTAAPLPPPNEKENPQKRDSTAEKKFNTEDYNHIVENEFLTPKNNPLSTFSIDVDNAVYSNVRRFINDHSLPPPDAVRLEEMINYFDYDYPQPTDEHPLSMTTELASCPWNKAHYLLHIGLKGKEMDIRQAPPSNLVFLLDVSGSMDEANKLPLVKEAFKVLVKNMREQDKVSIVVYAGAAGVVLPATSGSNKEKILAALNKLSAGGSTAGGEGILLAYKLAKQNFMQNGNNRIILATDGDFNVGVSSDGDLTRLVETQRKEGVYLTVLGFGMGNYKDNKLEILADKGNGNYAYIDNVKEANRIFNSEMTGTLYTIAKDVKLQLEFNPRIVAGYRLIGYENRLLAAEDFNDDTKDAGELGAGHTVTALYEIIPKNAENTEGGVRPIDPLKYQQNQTTNQAATNDLVTIKFRYKKPESDKSLLLEKVVGDKMGEWENSSENFRFSAAVAEFGMLLRNSKFKGNGSYQLVKNLGENALGKDENGYRQEFIGLVKAVENMPTAQVKRKKER